MSAVNHAEQFARAADSARQRKRLFNRADRLLVALAQMPQPETTHAELSAHLSPVCGILKAGHVAAAIAAVQAAARALPSIADDARAPDSPAYHNAAGIVAELRGVC